ncbi:hypothetical protein [Gracilimonas mengyeensis]|uniref:Quinol:cytochrome c oxidoreductase quinone-binding subunit 2 n=1 Tax=Gracilimonas mengyeensis TaxID=1302730 RepID=A0A521BBI2_9BACT|nr:hypothetical protein [Gracilimonas mengyeensis]SMO44110.1 quinol:cytochrome c oxidoreductase quinone-binding subunit 2 [Gracilimonas mengyeensis]
MSHKPTITDSLQFPADSKVPRALFGLGAAGLIATIIGYFLDADQFFFSYLVSFVFFTGIALAALLMVMLHHITRSSWGVVVRRISESFFSNLWIWAIFVLPIILGIHNLFHWSHPELLEYGTEEYDKIISGKSAYLNSTFFVIRQFIYFAIWGFLGYKLHQVSVKMDRTNDWGLTSLLRKFSAPGILLFAFTVAFASFDWLMSLDPHWFSTMFGVYFFAMSFQAFWAVMILTVFYLHRKGLLQETIRQVHVYDLGAWFFAFTVFYAYIAFSQFLLIYYANLPEETLWYYHRLEGGWQYIAYSLLIFRFVLPFIVLLNREAKKNRTVLGLVSALVLIVHFAEIYWIAMPAFYDHGIHFSWMDIAAFLGLGGIFFGLFFRTFKKHNMVPKNDPKLEDCLSKTYHQ